MTKQNWQQLLAVLVILIVLLIVWQIGQLVLPTLQAMAPIMAWTLLIAGEIVIVALALGTVGGIIVVIRGHHIEKQVKLIEAGKLNVTERGYMQGYISTSTKDRLLVPALTAHSVEVPSHIHIQTDNSQKGGSGTAGDWREQLAWAKLEWEKEKQALLNAPADQKLLSSPMPTIEEIVEEISGDELEVCTGKSLTTQELIKVPLIGKHIKVIGGTQMGKTCLVCAIIKQLCLKHSPARLRLAVLDLEDMNGLLFEDDPHILEIKVAGEMQKLHARNPEQVAEQLQWLHQIMLFRYELIQKRGLAYVEKQPRILIYFEEFLYWKKTLAQFVADPAQRQTAIDAITGISTRGLKVGMHLIIAAQVDYADKDLLAAMAQFVGVNVSFAVKPSAARSAGFVATDLLNQNFEAKTPGQYVIEMIGGSDMGVSPDFDAKAKVRALLAERADDSIIDGEYEEMEDLQYPDVSRSSQTPQQNWSEHENIQRPDVHTGDLRSPSDAAKGTRPSNVWTFSEMASRRLVDTAESTSEERPKEYRLSDSEIQQFIAAYKVSGSIDKSLSAIERGTIYRQHAREIVSTYGLRENA